ncbi:MAG: MBL fold metallo-hydrolase [Trueperaceae bacterium]
MATLYLLGTGASLSDPHRTTTMLAVENDDGSLLVDCGGDALQRLLASGGDPSRIRALIITHEHPDHVSGFPLLMEKLWLHGRREPLDVYGIDPAIRQAQRAHDSFDTSAWPDYPEIRYHPVALQEGAAVLERDGWQVSASPGIHAVPVVGLRFRDVTGGGVVAYSCDTEYCDRIVRLAQDAQVLIHEATGNGPGHSSAVEAARVAAEARAERLLLVHLPSEEQLGPEELATARKTFPNMEKGLEGGRYRF